VKKVSIKVTTKIKLAANQDGKERSIVQVGDSLIGGERITVIAGPCSVESREQILEVARRVRSSGATMLRGGAFKPRTLPYSFQGLGLEGLKLLAEAREETGLPIVTEVMTPEEVGAVEEYADVLQIGARNMQNYHLLRRVGEASKPVVLKRGLSSTVEEWLGAAEYILNGGNDSVILCERGIRAFERLTRFTLDLSVVPILKEVSHLPVIVDPSHGTGVRSLVAPMARAAVAAGADGLLVEVHPRPEEAKSDGPQSLTPEGFRSLMENLRPVAAAVGRTL
jgi:3-deoxy-7-phosphoheptulonate synthase